MVRLCHSPLMSTNKTQHSLALDPFKYSVTPDPSDILIYHECGTIDQRPLEGWYSPGMCEGATDLSNPARRIAASSCRSDTVATGPS